MSVATSHPEPTLPPERDAWIAEAITQHGARLHRIAAARVGPDHARDVVSEAFTTAWRRYVDFDASRGTVEGWLIGIVVRVCDEHTRAERRWLRRQVRLGARYVPTAMDAIDGAPERVDAAALARPLWRAISRLSRDERAVLLLVAHAGLTPTEIADALGQPAATIRSKLHRARQRVAHELGDLAGGTEP